MAQSGTLTNRCLESKSPYVRSHSKDPTAWQLWSPETLKLARDTNKLLFVSIGYAACHWCHVMQSESFGNPTIARLLNQHFIPIKIDREERPDVDRVYMDFLQATTGGGGWPLNVFVTPQLEPLFGGTYWPGPESDRAGKSGGFEQILEKVASAWTEKEAKCREDAGQITAQLRQFAQEGMLAGAAPRTDSALDGGTELPEIELLEDAYEYYKMRFDSKFGGFGGAPKFPTPAHLSFLLRVGQWPATVQDIVGQEETDGARSMVITTLRAMARGGIKDQVGRGFSRYSVTRDWSLPHFEKMLYDNAQLLSAYLDGYLITKDPLLLETVHDIATYLTSAPMQSETGGIHASEDADSAISASQAEHKEGAFYVWSADEFARAIGDAKLEAIAADYYSVKSDGNVSPRFDAQGELEGKNTLCISTTMLELATKHSIPEHEASQAIATAKQKLRKYREDNRPRPGLDDKIVVSWNGLAISALARTASALSTTSPDAATSYLIAATKAANFIKSQLYDSTTRTLKRVYRDGPGTVPGFADDYAFLITGLLDLYAATSDESLLEWAHDLQQTQLSLFYDHAGSGGFYSTAVDSEDVLIRSKDAMDNAEPSTNGVSATNLFRLAALLTATTVEGGSGQVKGENDFHKLAVRTIRAFEMELEQHPGLMTGLLGGVVMARLGVKSVLISGKGPKIDAALRLLRENVWPGVVLIRVPEAGVGEWLKGQNEVLGAIDPSKEMVQVCSGTECRRVGEADNELEELLRA